jgi:two-component sensor histidine kinase
MDEPDSAIRADRLSATPSGLDQRIRYLGAIFGIAAIYFLIAKLSLALASINPSATPIWPPTGLALAVLMLGGLRMWPAIFAGAFLANLITNWSSITSAAIAAGNTLECVTAAYLLGRWSNGLATFETPAGVARFAAICLFPSTAISATVGLGSLLLGGFAEPGNLAAIWLTWWMGDLGGALIVAPAIVLTAISRRQPLRPEALARAAAIFATAIAIGLVAFSPLAGSIPNSAPLGFLVIAPLMWSAVYQNQRDTAITVILITCFAVWGTLAGAGPFTQSTLNDSFLLLLAFMISISVPSLALSAHHATRAKHEQQVETVMLELSHRTKNLLSVIQSMARQIARHTDSFQSFDAAFADRIFALSKAHDLLVAGEWQGAEIGASIRAQLAAFIDSEDRRIVLEGRPLTLTPRAVEQIGLAIHELATNALKYGALSVEQGSVNINWRTQTGASDQPQLILEWTETGSPPVFAPARKGFGHLVITDLVPRSLNGRATLDFHADGVRWSLQVPIPVVATPLRKSFT